MLFLSHTLCLSLSRIHSAFISLSLSLSLPPPPKLQLVQYMLYNVQATCYKYYSKSEGSSCQQPGTNDALRHYKTMFASMTKTDHEEYA